MRIRRPSLVVLADSEYLKYPRASYAAPRYVDRAIQLRNEGVKIPLLELALRLAGRDEIQTSQTKDENDVINDYLDSRGY